MAKWTQNPPAGVGRRKWELEDRESLNNLKYHIAAEGCSEVQFDLAKQLLDKTIVQDEKNCNQEAVHWLCCAAQQGHEEAAKLLRKCYEDGCGITTQNEAEVECCISMTTGERAARKAARELFACLSNGNEHISPKQLERKMRKIYNMQKRRRRRSKSTSEDDSDNEHSTNESIEGISSSLGNGHMNLQQNHRSRHSNVTINNGGIAAQGGHVITEENLVSAAVNYASGRMPAVNDELTLSVPHPASLDHVPCFHRLLFHPIIFFTLLYHRLINYISSLPTSIPPSIRLATIFLAYWIVNNENLTIFLPVGFYYLCLGTMVWSTCKMLKTKQDFVDFRMWSGLFLSYGDHNVEADISENRFLKNNMKPYLYFFCAFIGNLIIYPLVASEWLPHSELTILSCVFVFVSLTVFMYSSSRQFPDWIVLVSFGINVLAKYPYEMDDVVTTGWRFLDLKAPTFCSFVIGNGIEFCLNCRTALYLLIPVFLVHLAKRSHWHGTYTYLIPHCVTLSWLQLCITTSQSATMFGVVRATLGLAGALLFLPLFGIVSLLIPVFVAIDWMGFTDPSIRLGSTLIASILALLASCFLAINRATQKYITGLQVLICIVAASVLTFPYMTSNFKDSSRFGILIPNANPTDDSDHIRLSSEHLSWQHYYTLCDHPAWESHNKIKSQLRCSHLTGVNVQWEGTVSQVQISGVSNVRSDLITKYLPSWIANLLRCLYGEHINEQLDCDVEKEPLCSDMGHIIKNALWGSSCSLHKWNSYDYEIYVKMSVGGILSKDVEVVLQATDKFGNFTRKLVGGDRVHFFGVLANHRVLPDGKREDFILGSSHAHVQLSGIKCIMCQDKEIEPVSIEHIGKSPVNARLRDLMRGIKYLLNVLLNPLITFK